MTASTQARDGRIPFRIWISYKNSNQVPVDSILNDLGYLERRYGNDAAYDHTYSSRPIFVWTAAGSTPSTRSEQ